MPTQNTQREDREIESAQERDPQPIASSFYMYFPFPGPALCKLG